MKPKIIKTDKYIEFIGHYDDITKCAKLSALASLYAIDSRVGYAKFPIEYEKDIDKALNCSNIFVLSGYTNSNLNIPVDGDYDIHCYCDSFEYFTNRDYTATARVDNVLYCNWYYNNSAHRNQIYYIDKNNSYHIITTAYGSDVICYTSSASNQIELFDTDLDETVSYYSIQDKQYLKYASYYYYYNIAQPDQPLSKTYNAGTFNNGGSEYNQIAVNGMSTDNSTFVSITDIDYRNTLTEASDTVYSNSTWNGNYNSVLNYTTTAPDVTAINSDCNSIVTFTTQQVPPDVTYDLDNLNLSPGTYTIGVKAEADGFADSTMSNTVTYVVAPSGYDLKLSSSASRSWASASENCVLTTNTGNSYNLRQAALGTTLETGVTSIIYTFAGASGTTTYSMNGSTGTLTKQNQSLTLTGDMTITAIQISCLTGDMLITMADNTKKRIDEIKVGDKVLSYNGNTIEKAVITYSDADVMKTHNSYDIWKFDDGTIIKTVHRHRLYNCESEAFVNMDEWKIGDHARTIDGKEIALIKHEHIDELVNHYTIFTDKYNNYFVNGLLAGNKYSAEITCDD